MRGWIGANSRGTLTAGLTRTVIFGGCLTGLLGMFGLVLLILGVMAMAEAFK
jgi:hypothetical protein